ncbi:MAG TPA: recombination mediator RecR [Thermoanaerobaculia bacterium]|nr:recombination mediator RecR [Thermoanaerobaculia bacterium]
MANSTDPLARLVGELARLPSIGPKTATRLAHHLLKVPRPEVEALAEALIEVKDRLFHCTTCNAITARDPCRICADPQRQRHQLCVVEEPFNIEPIERTGEFRGLYHVLLGALRPHRGIGPDEIDVQGLLARLEGVDEVILATNPNVEGEATALYLARVIKPRGPRVSRLAFGMPVGGDIEYTDEATLGRSIAGRRDL